MLVATKAPTVASHSPSLPRNSTTWDSKPAVYDTIKGLNNYQYYSWASLLQLWYIMPQNPILIIIWISYL